MVKIQEEPSSSVGPLKHWYCELSSHMAATGKEIHLAIKKYQYQQLKCDTHDCCKTDYTKKANVDHHNNNKNKNKKKKKNNNNNNKQFNSSQDTCLQ